MKIRVGHLYPDYLNIYADRGNIAVLAGTGARRAATSSRSSRSAWATASPGDIDLFYVGGGQDREQELVAPDLAARAEALRDAVEGGAAFLAVCGGYQLLGRSYRDLRGVELPGRRPASAAHRRRRAAHDRRRPARLPWAGETLAGFENHAGRTILDAGAEPLGRVVAGFGNDGASGFEGCRAGRVYGTYLHGPLLPAQPVVRRPAARRGPRAPHGRRGRARAARRRARARGVRRLGGAGAGARRAVIERGRPHTEHFHLAFSAYEDAAVRGEQHQVVNHHRG